MTRTASAYVHRDSHGARDAEVGDAWYTFLINKDIILMNEFY